MCPLRRRRGAASPARSTPLTNALGFAGTFFSFAGVCALALVWMYFYVPETRGKSLEQIEEMLREGRIR